ncbi:VOC family protein [Fulvivirga sp. M361]|uniref:VOC family protein n=1 Tax=Fulvivirga sp. M361 TaxID=2594266 RepID=UPI0011799EF7|nr:VOC family protein [Fulvivirga sp. M361]TRX60572.1 VOC family protein [Fulvivirga sp. M361]
MEVHYAYTILYVKNVPQSIHFYKNAFGFEQKFLTPENDYGEIISGTTTIAFASVELGNANLKEGFSKSDLKDKPFGIELAFTTQNVESLIKKATDEGAVLLEEVAVKPWGQKVGYIRDPDGFLLEICTPLPG